MSGSKLSQRLGLMLSSLLAIFVIYHHEEFLALEEWGNLMLLVSLGCSIVVLFAVSYKWEKLQWLRCIFQLLFFFAVPFETEDISYLVKIDVKIDDASHEEEDKDYYDDDLKGADELANDDSEEDEPMDNSDFDI